MAILNLDFTIVNLALPVIANVFRISLAHLEWINISFILAAACITLLSGHFADQYGRRKIFLIGIAIFTVGSLLAAAAVGTWTIVAGRTLQGLGVGISFPMTLILLSESFPEHQRGMAMGLLSTFNGVSQALGPTIGGLIVQWLGWRWAFIINLPICPTVMLVVWYKCQVGLAASAQNSRLHIPSVVAMIASLILILIALNQINEWSALSFWLCLGGGFVLLAAALFQQTRLASPWLDLTLFKNRTFAAINIIRMFFQFIFFGFYFVFPLYMQNFLGYSPGQTGVIILLMSGVMAILAPTTGRLIDKIGVQRPLILAQCCYILGFAAMLFTTIHLNLWIVGLGLILMGICNGITFPTTNFTAVHSLPSEKKGIGLGIFTTTSSLMSSVGVALSAATLSFVSSAHFSKLLNQNNLSPLAHQSSLHNIVTGAHPFSLLAEVNPNHSAIFGALCPTQFYARIPLGDDFVCDFKRPGSIFLPLYPFTPSPGI